MPNFGYFVVELVFFVIASVAKQSSYNAITTGLLRYARNDEKKMSRFHLINLLCKHGHEGMPRQVKDFQNSFLESVLKMQSRIREAEEII